MGDFAELKPNGLMFNLQIRHIEESWLIYIYYIQVSPPLSDAQPNVTF